MVAPAKEWRRKPEDTPDTEPHHVLGVILMPILILWWFILPGLGVAYIIEKLFG